MVAKALVVLLVWALLASGKHQNTSHHLTNMMDEQMIDVDMNVHLWSLVPTAQSPLMTPGKDTSVKYMMKTLVRYFGWMLVHLFIDLTRE